MSVRQSLLAILNQGPCYGYQLRTELDRRTGSSSPINVGQIYNTIDRLERDGLARQMEHEPESQTYYEITDAGRAEVASWLGSPISRSTARDELAAKLALAATLPGVDIARVLEAQRASTVATLERLREGSADSETPESAEELARLIMVESMTLAAEAELRWLDRCEELLVSARTAGIGAMPLSTEVPKRGRPTKADAG